MLYLLLVLDVTIVDQHLLQLVVHQVLQATATTKMAVGQLV
jgi:hypothetical protein